MIACPACGAVHAAPDFRCPACGAAPALVGGVAMFAPALAAEVEGFDDAAIASLAAAERGHFWFEARNRLIVDAMRRHVRADGAFLEVGAGTGYTLQAIASALPRLRLTASEVLASGLAHVAARLPQVRLVQLDARALPFAGEFDAIGAFDVIEHIAEDTAVLAQVHRALRDGGVALLAVPQHPWLWSAEDDVGGHVRRYRRGELEGKLRDAGFRIVDSTSFTTLLLPALWLSRRTAAPADAGDNAAELAPAPWLNGLLSAVMAFEGWLLRLGLRLPVGGSRLVVARKEPT